jgi:hypothetical protein
VGKAGKAGRTAGGRGCCKAEEGRLEERGRPDRWGSGGSERRGGEVERAGGG